MKQKNTLLLIALSALLISCGSIFPTTSRFVAQTPHIGMDKETFVATYGAPFRQNVYYDDNNAYCEELLYRERIEHGATTYASGELRVVNSIFLFREGKLVSQFQEDDDEFQILLERDKERRLIKESIDAEKDRAAAERERAAAERQRVELEKKKQEEKKND